MGEFDPIYSSEDNVVLRMTYKDIFTTQISIELTADDMVVTYKLGDA